MPAKSRFLSDPKLVALAAAFLEDADTAAVRSHEEMTAAFTDGHGWASHSGVTFVQRPAVRATQAKLVDAILRKLSTRAGHEDEVRSATWREAAMWLQADVPAPVAEAARQLLKAIEERDEVTADLVLPNYTFRRAPGIQGVRIGPVEILDAQVAKAKVDALEHEHLRFLVDGGSGSTFRDGALEVSCPATCWWVRVAGSQRNVRDEGAWLVDMAISLARFLHRPWGGLAVGHKDHEPHAFEPTRQDQPGAFFVGNHFSAGGRTAARYYELDDRAVRALESDRAQAVIASIFEPTKHSVGARVALALAWLTRARRTRDRFEALLFYFTALETLLVPGKSEPVSQTISRQVAVILRDKPTSRRSMFQRMRQLYDMRSTLVHAGQRTALAGDVRTMSVVTDQVFMRVVNDVDLTIPAEALIASLSDATFGDPWEPPKAEPLEPSPEG